MIQGQILHNVSIGIELHSTEANSTDSVEPMPVNPPTTISWLLGRRAAIQLYRGVSMWLMTS